MIYEKIKEELKLEISPYQDYKDKSNLHFSKITNGNGYELVVCDEAMNCAANNEKIGIEMILEKLKDQFRIDAPIHPLDPVNLPYDDIKGDIKVRFENRVNTVIDSNIAINFGNLVLIPYTSMTDGEDGEIICDIHSYHLDKWNITVKDVFKQAKENSKGDIEIQSCLAGLYIARTVESDSSDIIMFMDRIEEICENLNANCILLPFTQSIFGIMIYSDEDQRVTLDEYKNFALDILNMGLKGEHMDENVYHYNHKTKTFDFCGIKYTLNEISNMFV